MNYWDQKENTVMMKSKAFALRIIRAYKFLSLEKREFILSKQLLRCGTSIGANVREAHRAQSPADFYAKMNIALKEADETPIGWSFFMKAISSNKKNLTAFISTAKN